MESFDLITLLVAFLIYSGILVFASVYSFNLGYKARNGEPLITNPKMDFYVEEEEIAKEEPAEPIQI